MTNAASSYIGLLRQLADAGWDDDALTRAHRAHDLARTLVAGLFNGDGRPFVCHLLSLASLLARYGRPQDVVVAGLLHSVYAHGDFGLCCSFPRARQRVRDAVGPDVETLVLRFHTLAWNARGLDHHVAQIDRMDPLDREVVRMRLANELDHLLDGAAWMRADADRYLAARADRMDRFVALASALEMPALAQDLVAALAATTATPIPAVCRESTAEPFALLPASAGRKLVARAADTLVRRAPKMPAVIRLRPWPPRG